MQAPLRNQHQPQPQPQARGTISWPPGSRELAEQLQRSLCIGDRDWHALKGQRSRRAAEQLAAALVLLLSEGGHGLQHPEESIEANRAARQRALEHTAQALGWLKGEIRDPGCPQHGR